MKLTKFVILTLGLITCASAHGSPTGTSLGLNFSPDEPDGAMEGYVEGPAGVAGTANWNNLPYDEFFFEDLEMDVSGSVVNTGASVEWLAQGTWSSDGRGNEDTNDAPDGSNDRALMLGYLDTSDTSITEITVSDLPAALSDGFDVLVYVQGGVLGRGGTYTIGDQSQDHVVTNVFEGGYTEGSTGNYLKFEGLSGNEFTLEAMATTPALFRGPVNAIEICKPGECLPLPTPVAGRANIGDQTVSTMRENEVFAPAGDPSPGLAQEWFAVGNPGNKDAIDQIFDDNEPITAAFRAGHGTTWWSGDQEPYGDLVKYPDELPPPFNGSANNDNYVTRLTGEIRIEESGTYRFADAVDDFTWLAIDTDKSGVAGDDPDEVLIDDNAWTGVLREQNGGGQGWAEVDIDVDAGGEWLAIEFNQGEGGGSDSGIVFWDYDPNAPEGDRLGGQEGFPEFPEDPVFIDDAPDLYVPDSHLRSVTKTLLSADLVGEIDGGFEFEVNGDDDTADRFVVDNPNDQIFTSIVDVDGLSIFMSVLAGDVQDGDSYQIVAADQINGTPTVITPGWSFNPATGMITFGTALPGDYNGDGVLDATDIDLQAVEMKVPAGEQDLAKFDHNNDDVVNEADRTIWVKTLKGTWVGDSNFDNEFNSGDLVQVFAAGKYETGDMAGWAEGDWDGNMFFDSSDLVAAFTDGGYELGPPAVAAVPEPSAVILFVLGLLGLCRCRRS